MRRILGLACLLALLTGPAALAASPPQALEAAAARGWADEQIRIVVAKGALAPEELSRAFVRYRHVEYYDPARFDRAYEWMKARGLSDGGSEHAALVVG